MMIVKRISSLLIVIAVALIVSCENEKLIFEGPYFIRFTEDGLTQKESHIPPLKIEVHNAGPVLRKDLTINYVIGGSARQGIDYVINGTPGKLKIKSGEYFGTIEVQLINNANNILESQDVTFTLQNIEENNTNLRLGQDVSHMGTTFTLLIQDDCILGGDYYGIRDSRDVPVENITLISLDCEEYTLSNWDVYIDSLQFTDVRDLKLTDNGDNTITIRPQKDDTLPPAQAIIDGSGVVDPTTRIITLTVRLAGYKTKPSFTFQLIPY